MKKGKDRLEKVYKRNLKKKRRTGENVEKRGKDR